MNYRIITEIKKNRYKIFISLVIPNLEITRILNFRIKSVTLLNNNIINDPDINNSNYIFEISNSMINTECNFIFDFDIFEISNIKNITIGFCNELIRWYEDTFEKINIDLKKINISKKDKNKICMLSTWNIKCGISQYSKNLYDALETQNYVVKVFPNLSNYSDVFNFIKINNFNIFLVQYEPSIIQNFELLLSNIILLKKQLKEVKVFFVIHSENQDLLKLDGIIDGFIYHKNNTLNFKKTKINLLPMGVPIFEPEAGKDNYREKYGLNKNMFILSTVGFMFGWKQHALILESLVPTIKNNPNFIVQLLTSFHSINNNECIVEFNKIQQVILENNIQSQVIHVTDYISQKELNERLYMSDLGFLWAGIETTSSSASLKEFVSSRLPVVRTDSSHYHDISLGCKITKKDMAEFCLAINNLYSNNNELSLMKDDMSKNYNKMNYKNIVLYFIEAFNA